MIWAHSMANNKRARVKANKFVVDGSKKGRPKKRWKEVAKKDMLARGLKRTNAQDCSVWKLSCKNWLTHVDKKTSPVLERWRYRSTLLGQMDDDDDEYITTLLNKLLKNLEKIKKVSYAPVRFLFGLQPLYLSMYFHFLICPYLTYKILHSIQDCIIG